MTGACAKGLLSFLQGLQGFKPLAQPRTRLPIMVHCTPPKELNTRKFLVIKVGYDEVYFGKEITGQTTQRRYSKYGCGYLQRETKAKERTGFEFWKLEESLCCSIDSDCDG